MLSIEHLESIEPNEKHRARGGDRDSDREKDTKRKIRIICRSTTLD